MYPDPQNCHEASILSFRPTKMLLIVTGKFPYIVDGKNTKTRVEYQNPREASSRRGYS